MATTKYGNASPSAEAVCSVGFNGPRGFETAILPGACSPDVKTAAKQHHVTATPMTMDSQTANSLMSNVGNKQRASDLQKKLKPHAP